MASVMIGIDPHKASHTAVAIGGAEEALGELRVRASAAQAERLSRRGNRRINHAIHMAAITQIRQPHSDGRAYYDKKLTEGKTHKEALRSLKRQISDAVFARLRADARRGADQSSPGTREGSRGTALQPARPDHTPENRLFG